MAHFAQIDASNKVLRVISVSDADAPDPAPANSEPLGQAFIASLGLGGRWVQTSYNGSFRGRYAGIGYVYREDLDMFIAPQPWPSWTLDDAGDWQPPVPRPDDDDYIHIWNENNLAWDSKPKPAKPNVEILGE